jgi:hypothetical protein
LTDIFQNRVMRPVRVHTWSMTVDGLINVSLGGRTLDELNYAMRSFLSVGSPSVVTGDVHVTAAPLLISKEAILFVLELTELGSPPRRVEIAPEIRRFNRTAIRLRVGDFEIEGYVNALPGTDSLARLQQPGPGFLALNSATVVGPGVDLALPFLAVNRLRIVAAQEIFSIAAEPEEFEASADEAVS